MSLVLFKALVKSKNTIRICAYPHNVESRSYALPGLTTLGAGQSTMMRIAPGLGRTPALPRISL